MFTLVLKHTTENIILSFKETKKKLQAIWKSKNTHEKYVVKGFVFKLFDIDNIDLWIGLSN
jgi:hypothetical protein